MLYEVITAKKELKNKTVEIDQRSAATIILVSGGYPEAYEKNKIISGIDEVKDSIVFHSGTTNKDGNIVSSGGRVLAVSSFGTNIFEALQQSYNSASKINFDKMYYRSYNFV